MEKDQYKILYELEDDYWWHTGLRNLVTDTVASYVRGKCVINILDAGCGTGANLAALKQFGYAVGLDISDEAIRFSRHRDLSNLLQGSVSVLPFKDNSFDVLLCMDVLYHKAVNDDVAALEEFYRVLRRGGLLLLQLGAFEFLKGPHDELVHTQRRYLKNDVLKKMISAGFKVKKNTYRNFILFFLAAFLRIYNRKGKIAEFREIPGCINKILSQLIIMENLLIRNINLPLGLSVFSIAEKQQKV